MAFTARQTALVGNVGVIGFSFARNSNALYETRFDLHSSITVILERTVMFIVDERWKKMWANVE